MPAASIRFIDTTGLPKGFDVADLVAQGTIGADLVAWCKTRIRPGSPPPEPVAVPNAPDRRAKKTPGDEGVGAGGRGVTATGEQRSQSTATRARVSTPPVAPPRAAAMVAAPTGNVVPIKVNAEPEPDLGMPPEYSDDSLANAFANAYDGELLFVNDWKRWMLWGGALWEHDNTLRATDMARRVCRTQGNEALVRPDLASKARSIATALTSARTIANTERLARSDLRMSAKTDQWDPNPWVLNTPGGIVDLTTGLLRPARKDDFVTKSTSVTPGGVCPTWLNFLNVATDGDSDLVGYLRRMVGYCLTGITREHALFFVYGTGGNGKGTFLNTLNQILNNYSKPTSMETFVEQKFSTNGDTANVAGLMGARIVMAQETQEGKRWNEARLKEMSGGDPVTARFLGANPFTFTPQFKLVFAGNHKPALRNLDEAIKRRFNMIPFTVTVPAENRDVHLSDKLQAEASGILQWAVDGCLDWQDNFLAPPERVQFATEEYFEEEDTIGNFFDECCTFDKRLRVKTSELYSRYGRWCESSGEWTLPKKRWLQQLALRSMVSQKLSGDMTIEGVAIRQELPYSGGGSDWTD